MASALVRLASDLRALNGHLDLASTAILTAVELGHLEGRPATESTIARTTGLSKQTVARRLQMLVDEGEVLRQSFPLSRSQQARRCLPIGPERRERFWPSAPRARSNQVPRRGNARRDQGDGTGANSRGWAANPIGKRRCTVGRHSAGERAEQTPLMREVLVDALRAERGFFVNPRSLNRASPRPDAEPDRFLLRLP
jgi:hypothetical protein